jgi:hypothetical protein
MRLPAHRIAVLAAAALAAVVATLPSSAAPDPTPNRETCAGYPEKRVFLESQAWWSAMPGTGKTGHIHIGMCVPLYQTLTSDTLHLDMKWQLHDFEGAFAPDFWATVEGTSIFTVGLKDFPVKDAGLWKPIQCAMMQCEGWISYDLPLKDVPISGWQWLNIYPRGFLGDGRGPLRPLSLWPINVQNGKPDGSIASANSPIAGGSWFVKPPNNSLKYALVGLARPEIEKLWNPSTGELVSKSGKFDITASFDMPGARVMVDPAFHAMPPSAGTVVLDKTVAESDGHGVPHTVTIDTTKLANGRHRLVFQTRHDRVDGQHSGLFVLPFLVANDSATPPPGSPATPPPGSPATPPPGSPATPPPGSPGPTAAYHPKCEPTCDEQIAELKEHITAMHAMTDELGKQLADEKATTADLRDKIAQALKALGS